MASPSDGDSGRRRWLQISAAAVGFTMFSPLLPPLNAAEDCSPPLPKGPFNGSTCPFPIPWLDKNGNHNQMPKPGVELSHIYHFHDCHPPISPAGLYWVVPVPEGGLLFAVPDGRPPLCR